MYYDLHIHSALSPCANDDMTINNIVNMAMIKGLDLIAVTDHNSVKQLAYLEDITKGKVQFLYGVELQSKEEIHILAYFKDKALLEPLQDWIDEHLIVIQNRPEFFGQQLIFNEKDEVKKIEERLLISSLDLSINEICDHIHQINGIVVLAHVLDKRYSITASLGFIPMDLDYDGIEVKSKTQEEFIKKNTPYLKDVFIFYNSDAHQLIDIHEPLHQISDEEFNRLWR